MTESLVRSIKCPGCGAPIDPRGGHVCTMVCSYCGTVMDVRTHAATGGRSKQKNIKTILRPDMKGTVSGELLTVVGLARCYAENTAWDTAFLLGQDEGRGVVVRSQAGNYQQLIPLARDRVPPIDPHGSSVRIDGKDIPVSTRHEGRVSYLEGQLLLGLRKDRPVWSLEAGHYRVEWSDGDYRAYEARPLSFEAIQQAFDLGGGHRPQRQGRAPAAVRPPAMPAPVRRTPSVASRLISLVAVGMVVMMMAGGAVVSMLVSATASVQQSMSTPAISVPSSPPPTGSASSSGSTSSSSSSSGSTSPSSKTVPRTSTGSSGSSTTGGQDGPADRGVSGSRPSPGNRQGGSSANRRPTNRQTRSK